ncbi:MAG: bifunctional homocysteine S-methyltransferase/methylenetetrahydrofolate reductase [Thermomicrobiales bacterium]
MQRLQNDVLISDGAMGTMLHSSGVSIDDCFDALNLDRPNVVAAVHHAFIAAGADVIETNTFGANRFLLEQFGLGAKVRDINRRAVKIAREAREISGRPVFVAGSVGPTQRTLAPYGALTVVELERVFREQIDALLEGGVDLLMIETISDLEEMLAAIRAAKAAADLPIVAMMTFAEDGNTVAGNTVGNVVAALCRAGADVVGANCSVGPQRILPVVESIADELRDCSLVSPIACMPTAGWPTRVGGRVIYPSPPEYLGTFALDAAELGVRLIGGCCGTTPDHIRSMRAAIDGRASRTGEQPAAPHEAAARQSRAADRAVELVAPEGPTQLAQKLGKKFVVCVEIDPPKGLNPAKAIEGARLLKSVGVDAINVADSPMARVRMSAMTLSYLIQHEVGIETIVHFTTRDRSLMGLQSELLGAHSVGVRNILALTGDPPSLGDYPDSSAVYDVDSIGLIRVLGRMNGGTDSAGASIGRMASFTIGCAVDPTKSDPEEEVRRLREKLAAGVQFVMTQPIFDARVWSDFLAVYGEPIHVPVMIGILPLQSSKHAEFLHNEVPGITLTDDARTRMREAGAHGRAEGVAMARDLLTELRPKVQGVYIMPSFGRYEVVAEVLDGIV